jgi:hypothetical protein
MSNMLIRIADCPSIPWENGGGINNVMTGLSACNRRYINDSRQDCPGNGLFGEQGGQQ